MARALVLTAAALATLAATSAAAQPSPYAGDRYGPVAGAAPGPYGPRTVAPQPVAGQAPPLRGRMLMWPGKVDHITGDAPPPRPVATVGWTAPAPRAVYAPPQAAAPTQAYRAAFVQPRPWTLPARQAVYAPVPPPVAQAAPPERALSGAPTQGWRPVFAARTSAPAPAAAPPSSAPVAAPTYNPAFAAARAAPPNRAMAADRRYGYDPTLDHSVRFYSVGRPFGVKPDPAPIPPQFFTATADLSGGDPPGPLPVNHTTAATRAAVVGGSDAGSQ